MRRLGYARYVAQGGDQGAGVTDAMGRQAPDGLLGVHFNLLDAAPRELLMAALNLRLAFSGEDREQFSKFTSIVMRGYIAEMGEHPQTIGYPLVDSPLGLAAWMLDHDADSYEKISRAFVDGQVSGNLTRDHILDNITLYWLTGTGASTSRLYGSTGRAQRRRSRIRRRTSNSRSLTRYSRTSSSRRRATGSSTRTITSRTSTRRTRAGTSPRGKSPSSSPARCVPHSSHCVDRHSWAARTSARRLRPADSSGAGATRLEPRPRIEIHSPERHISVTG